MNLCSDRHDEVCYAVRFCPVCESREEIGRLERETEALRDEIRELKEA